MDLSIEKQLAYLAKLDRDIDRLVELEKARVRELEHLILMRKLTVKQLLADGQFEESDPPSSAAGRDRVVLHDLEG